MGESSDVELTTRSNCTHRQRTQPRRSVSGRLAPPPANEPKRKKRRGTHQARDAVGVLGDLLGGNGRDRGVGGVLLALGFVGQVLEDPAVALGANLRPVRGGRGEGELGGGAIGHLPPPPPLVVKPQLGVRWPAA